VTEDEEVVDFLREDCAAAIGSPQGVSAYVGNPPSRVREIPGGRGGSEEMDDDSEEPAVHAPAALRGFDGDWDCPSAGHCEPGASPLARELVVGGLAARRPADCRSPGGDWEVEGASSPCDDAAKGRALTAPRASPDIANWGRSGIDAWALMGSVTLPLADAAEDQSLMLAAVERTARGDCSGTVGAVRPWEILVLAVLGPPTLRASSSPSTLFEPEADRPLPLGRLTLGALSPSSHKDPSSARPSVPATLSCG